MTPPDHIPLYASLLAAGLIASAIVVSGLVGLRKRHRDASVWVIYGGASVYGAVFGAIIVFAVMPMRSALTAGDDFTPQMGASAAAVFGLVYALRTGLLARAPLFGPLVRAYRRAMLRKSIEDAEKALKRLGGGRDDAASS